MLARNYFGLLLAVIGSAIFLYSLNARNVAPSVECKCEKCAPTTTVVVNTVVNNTIACIRHDYINMEPPKPNSLTGPRDQPLQKMRKSLVAIPVGSQSKSIVSKLVEAFGLENFQFMLFHYDTTDWSDQAWYNKIISIRVVGRMKWWYIKRFIHPALAENYEYIFAIDEDSDPEHIDVPQFLNILRKNKIGIAQPANHKESQRAVHTITHQVLHNDSSIVGRWTTFVECGAFTVFSSEQYNACVWDFIQEDLTSGWGLDLYWHDYCKKTTGKEVSAVIDKYPQIHRSLETAEKSAKEGRPAYHPWQELESYGHRYPHLQKSQFVNLGNIRE